MTDILARIITLVSANTGVESATIASGTDFESLGFDSLSLTEMTVAIKREFSVDTDEDELARCATVGEMARVVAALAHA